MRHRLAVCTLAIVGVTPVTLAASDFSIFRTIFNGLYLVLAVLIGLACWGFTRGRSSAVMRGVVWGSCAALVLMPLTIDGGNGTSMGPPLSNFIWVLFDGDPVYARDSIRPLFIGAVVASAVLTVVFHFWPALSRAIEGPTDDADGQDP